MKREMLVSTRFGGFAKKSNSDFQFYATVMFVRCYVLEEAAGTR